LLGAGALITDYAPTMYQCKVMIVDGLLVSVGSTNFDKRSFRRNDEATLNAIDTEAFIPHERGTDFDIGQHPSEPVACGLRVARCCGAN
jgi:cardiolipin synthase